MRKKFSIEEIIKIQFKRFRGIEGKGNFEFIDNIPEITTSLSNQEIPILKILSSRGSYYLTNLRVFYENGEIREVLSYSELTGVEWPYKNLTSNYFSLVPTDEIDSMAELEEKIIKGGERYPYDFLLVHNKDKNLISLSELGDSVTPLKESLQWILSEHHSP